MSTTDTSLLQKLRSKGDSTAWSRFVQLYTPLVYRWVRDLGIDEPDSADVVQEVFVVLLGKVSTFRYDPQGSFRGWLRQVTINKSRDHLRRKYRLSEPRLLERIERAATGDQELLTRTEYQQHLARAALKLMKAHFSETTWKACWSHVVEGKTAREIASELGVTSNAVYLARGRVLKRLRQELQGLWE